MADTITMASRRSDSSGGLAMLDVIVLVAMAVTAAAFAVGLILHSGIAQIPALIAAGALYMVMAASYLMVARTARPTGASRRPPERSRGGARNHRQGHAAHRPGRGRRVAARPPRRSRRAARSGDGRFRRQRARRRPRPVRPIRPGVRGGPCQDRRSCAPISKASRAISARR